MYAEQPNPAANSRSRKIQHRHAGDDPAECLIQHAEWTGHGSKRSEARRMDPVGARGDGRRADRGWDEEPGKWTDGGLPRWGGRQARRLKLRARPRSR